MFNLDRWREILDTLWRSKLRSLLTAFSVAWGIFMLVFLLGMGTGLQNGVQQEFSDDATNSVWMFAGRTSMPFDGMPIGRRLVFANRDVTAIHRLTGVDKITGRFIIGGRGGPPVQSRVGNKVAPYDVRSVHPDHLYLENTLMVAGRFLNDVDIQEKRKVCVIGEPVARFLFGTTEGVIGRWLEINRSPFQVVGLFTDEGGEGEREKIYIPITTSQTAFNGADHVHQTMFALGPDVTVAESRRVARAALETLAAAHHFSPDDTQAVRVRNNAEQFENFLQIFLGIRVFVVFMGICSLVAGVIGVSNIMMIVVRERTREIGVRKALGATPSHIVTSIVQEAVFITTLAGYLGLVAGIGGLALIDSLLPPTDMFAHPEVDLKVALGATVVLVIAGALAGLFPARAAARVNPIHALKGRMIGALDIDNWREIAATLRKNRLRTFLTGLGVFLGIVILLLMIGFGRSLERGVQRRMAGFATNAVFVWGQRTTKPYAGLPIGRQIKYDNGDIDALARVPGVLHLAPRAQRGGFMQGSNVRYGAKTGAFQVSGDYPAFQYVQTPVMRAGRFLNQRDLDESRKIAVLGEGVVEQLYGGANPIGTYIEANGIYFQVVGVFGSMQTGQQADRILNTIHIPFSTFQRAFNYIDRVDHFAVVGQPGVNGGDLENRLKDTLKQRHKVDPDDDDALGAWNTSKEFGKMTMLFFLINFVMWAAGTMCLLAGVVGVSNIMLITVRERTKEIGVRKALGATPASIIRMIVSEATVLTVIFGYLGVAAGVALLEVVGKILEKLPDLPFAPPDPNLTIALSAAGVIAVFGALAGMLPAYYAAKIRPVEALRTE